MAVNDSNNFRRISPLDDRKFRKIVVITAKLWTDGFRRKSDASPLNLAASVEVVSASSGVKNSIESEI
jgi:hypothetical protein